MERKNEEARQIERKRGCGEKKDMKASEAEASVGDGGC